MATIRTVAAVLGLFIAAIAAEGQSLSVLPVNVFLAPGQNAAALTVSNQGNSNTSIQIRAYAWSQANGEDQLAPTDALVVSPPITTIAPGEKQVVRLILRQSAKDREATYRILIDQIPPPAEPGVVHVVLRMSIPVFAQPAVRAVPQVQFHLESDSGQVYLVGTNDGLRHEAIRDIALVTSDGAKFTADPGVSPYILAGVTRRWHIAVPGSAPLPSENLRLTAHADSGAIEQQVRVVGKP